MKDHNEFLDWLFIIVALILAAAALGLLDVPK